MDPIVNDPGGSHVLTAAANAAPVGVTYSPLESVILSGRECLLAMFATAGAGTGMRPCWHLIIPVPSYRSEKQTSSTSSSSMQIARAAMSMIESNAPTSWKWTSFIGTPWASASASARIVAILTAIPNALGLRSPLRKISTMSGYVRCSWQWSCA